MQAIVVTFDRLATTALGCYGNEWIETPHFDRLASQGVVFDRHFVEHVGASVGMGFGTGRLPREASARPYDFHADWSQLTSLADIKLELFTEFDAVPWSMVLPKTSSNLIAVRHKPDPQPDTIPFACLAKSACERLGEPREPADRIVWLHSAGVPEPWLPPEGFATLYFDEYEARGFETANITRDNWGTHPAAYAGYVSLLDYWLGELIVAVEVAAKSEPTLLIIAAARGDDWMSLPVEHAGRRVESVEPPVGEESSLPVVDNGLEVRNKLTEPFVRRKALPLSDTITRTPLLLRLFDQGVFHSEFAGTRSNRLVQTVDLSATLLDYFGLPVTQSLCDGRSLLRELAETSAARDMICFTDGAGLRGIRTAEWSCFVAAADSTTETEATTTLFAKPEDIWEANDVSGQHRDITASFVTQLNELLPAVMTESNHS